MSGLKQKGVEVDRKVLADLAVMDPEAFSHLSSGRHLGGGNQVGEHRWEGLGGRDSRNGRRGRVLTVRLGMRHQRVQRLRRFSSVAAPDSTDGAFVTEGVKLLDCALDAACPSNRSTSVRMLLDPRECESR